MTLSAGEQAELNSRRWRAGEHVGEYASRRLLPVEVLLLVRYREALSGRVLEVGCGAGRVLGYLVALGGEVHGIDISPAMVSHCAVAYPSAEVRVGDLRDLRSCSEGRFSAIVAIANVLDVLDDGERRSVLAEIRELLAPEGLLIFSSHNLEYLDRLAAVGERPGSGAGIAGGQRTTSVVASVLSRPLGDLPQLARRLPGRIRNRRRLAALQRTHGDYAVINDAAHDYAFLHYYIRHDAQRRQLAAAGYELLECLDPDGRRVAAGEPSQAPWLHYVARRAALGAPPSDPPAASLLSSTPASASRRWLPEP